jgi:YfiR/HmsC-like
MRRRLAYLAVAMLASSVMLASQAVTQPALKAAFLFNFAKFVEWPADSAAPSPLTLCVLDDGAVEDALAQLVNGGLVNGRTVTLVKAARNRSLRGCHLLYVGDSDEARMESTLDEVKGAPILTVGDGEAFARRGGMIGLFVEDGRMRFAINPDAAQRVGLRFSSRLLSLAKIVKEGRHGHI